MTATTFTYTGAPQTYVVPAGVTSLQFDIYGAQGAAGFPNTGRGGWTRAIYPVTPGETLGIYVGGCPAPGVTSGATSPAGGWNGGGSVTGSGTAPFFPGGGASDVRQGGSALANRILVAGGGAGFAGGYGGGGYYQAANGPGGFNQPSLCAHAGTTAGGGAGSGGSLPGGNGTLGVGGDFQYGGEQGGAGGGGYYGGGGGGNQPTYDPYFAYGTSGAGGASYVGPSATSFDVYGAADSNVGNGQIIITQLTPDAPSLASPATNQVLQGAVTQRFQWAFSSPIVSDSQSGFDLRYRVVSTSTWTTINQATPNPFVDIAAGTLSTPGNYEWQVRTYESLGQVGPYSGSGFFTVATPTGAPTITAPTSGATIAIATGTVVWSTSAAQASYQVRILADGAAGAPDPATVIYDSNEVVSSTLRTHPLTFATNNVYEHIEVRIKVSGLWSPWADVRVNVSFTQPPAPVILLTPDNGSIGPPFRAPNISVVAANPVPVGGQPAVITIDIYRSDDGVNVYRIAKNLPPNLPYLDVTPASGIDYSYKIRAFAANGVYADSALTSALIHVNPDSYGGYNVGY